MMKRNVRRIFSLVLVLILLCGMVPGALAATTNEWAGLGCYFGYHSYSYVPQYGYVCQYCYTPYTSSGSGNIYGHNHTYSPYTSGTHMVICSDYGTSCPYHGTTEAHTITSSGYCTYCGYYGTGSSYGHDHEYTQYSDSYHYVTCSNTACAYYPYDLEAHTGTPCYYCGYTYGYSNLNWSTGSAICVATGTYHDADYNSTYDYYFCDDCNAYASGYGTGSQLWSNGSSYCTGTSTPHYAISGANGSTYCAYCYATYGYGYTGSLSWSNSSAYCTGGYTPHTPVLSGTYGGVNYYTCGNTGCSATATGYATGTGSSTGSAVGTNGKLYVTGYDSMTNDTYTMNETVTLSVYPSMYETTDTTANYDFYYTWSGDAYSYDNSGTAYLDTSGSTATAYCTVTAYPKNTTVTSSTTPTDTATVYWYATAQATDNIIYSALKGENVVLDEDDFEEFWEEQYPYGTLSYVRFTNVSSGNLYDNYAGGTSLRTDVRSHGSSCYLDPTATQIGLDDLTYVPSTYSGAGTVTIQFTAYGTSNYGYNNNYGYGYGSSYGTTSLSGTITILYTAKEVTPIVYGITADSVTLDGDDFVAKYKEVMDVSYTGSLSIQFLEAPTFGSLYMNYGSSYWYQSTGTQLTDKNIGNYTFSTSSVGTYSIDDLTYTPGSTSVGDTIRFACYSGNTLKFVGTVTFGASEAYTVEITTTAGKAVTFSSSNFTTADSSGLLTSGYLYFGTPNAGTLYKNYANGTGTRVTTSDYFTAGNLNTVTFVPRTGFIGVAEIPYTAYTYLGEQISGTVKVYVGRAFTDIAGTSHVWAQSYIDKLSSQNIVTGTGDGTTYSPGKELSYGEALTLIMRAVGYPEQTKTGTHWASGFLTKAYADGLVTSSTIDLDSKVNRDTIATITAKALKLNYASSVNYGITGPSDSANGYVYALYNAGILSGVNQNGKNYYLGSNYITRAEISKIICLVADYEA